MKVLVGALTNDKSGWDEPGIMRDLRAKNPESPGYRHIVQLLDEFVIEGPNGKHITLVVEAMDVSVFDVYRRMRDPMPLPLVKRVAKHTLLALQYMHECNIIHTGNFTSSACAASHHDDRSQISKARTSS